MTQKLWTPMSAEKKPVFQENDTQ